MSVFVSSRKEVIAGKYKMLRRIGGGSFGDIYLAINVASGEETPIVKAVTLLNGLVSWNPAVDVFCTPSAIIRRMAGEYLEKLGK